MKLFVQTMSKQLNSNWFKNVVPERGKPRIKRLGYVSRKEDMHSSFSNSEMSSFNFYKKVVNFKLYPIRKKVHHLSSLLFQIPSQIQKPVRLKGDNQS